MAAQKCAEIAVPSQPSAGTWQPGRSRGHGVTGAAAAQRTQRTENGKGRERGEEQSSTKTQRTEQTDREREGTRAQSRAEQQRPDDDGVWLGRTVVVGGAVDLKQVAKRRDLHRFPNAIPQAVHDRDVHRTRLEERKVRTPCQPGRWPTQRLFQRISDRRVVKIGRVVKLVVSILTADEGLEGGDGHGCGVADLAQRLRVVGVQLQPVDALAAERLGRQRLPSPAQDRYLAHGGSGSGSGSGRRGR